MPRDTPRSTRPPSITLTCTESSTTTLHPASRRGDHSIAVENYLNCTELPQLPGKANRLPLNFPSRRYDATPYPRDTHKSTLGTPYKPRDPAPRHTHKSTPGTACRSYDPAPRRTRPPSIARAADRRLVPSDLRSSTYCSLRAPDE